LVRGLGSENIDYRLRNAEFPAPSGIRWLGTSIASLSTLQRVLVVGSNLRKDHPLFAQRIRQAVRHGCAVSAIDSEVRDWAMPVSHTLVQQTRAWDQALAGVAAAIAQEKGVQAPDGSVQAGDSALAIARSLLGGERKAILLGNAAAHHAHASRLLALAQWIGEQTGATVGYLTEAANTVGAQFAGAMPGDGGLNAGQMLGGSLKAAILLNTEPEFDAAGGEAVCQALANTDMVVTLSPFKANMAFSDVLLPIAPFTETSGSFVNAEGRLQSFHAVVRPLGETRPAWKVLRVLANLLNVPGFDFETSQEVLARATNTAAGGAAVVPSSLLSNAQAMLPQAEGQVVGEPVVASIYQLDGMVRRATSLQLTADARRAQEGAAA
jgi:NADH-quinone oxidoreductase subunit G